MTNMTKILGLGAGLAAIATAAPATAQYGPYGYNQYGYSQYGYSPYGSSQYGYSPYGYSQYGNRPYAYGYANRSAAVQQCTAAVQNRLYTRGGLAGILGSLVGISGTSARVLSVTSVSPGSTAIRVRGLASSGRMSSYNPYGIGYYGALGYQYRPDLSFRCDVDYSGYVRNVSVYRR